MTDLSLPRRRAAPEPFHSGQGGALRSPPPTASSTASAGPS